ncbi:MAG: hypothetical protein IKE45_15425 [Halomonas sp.]|nr:hypothetical protein [Halomonas sp.]MBR2515372.1 hypothetical protein [Halomonas sp.]
MATTDFTHALASPPAERLAWLRQSRGTSRGKVHIFPAKWPPHIRTALPCWNELCVLQHTHSTQSASYEIRVHRLGGLPQAYVRFHLAVDTLPYWLTTAPNFTARDFHPIDVRRTRRTEDLSGRRPKEPTF